MDQMKPRTSVSTHKPTGGEVRSGLTSAVVVHSGARDSYQVAIALYEAGLLDTLVTDLYTPRLLQPMVKRRFHPDLPSSHVCQCLGVGLRELLMPRLHVSADRRRRSIRASDKTLGITAGSLAAKHGSGLVTYSYYAYDAIRAYGHPALLFQVHPHPATIRRLLAHELALHPDCAASLTQEWELAVPEEDFQHLVEEPKLASRLLAASTFTRDSLVQQGIPADRITVIPYGVDTEQFSPEPRLPALDSRLQLLFVGRINQRKGIKYLLEALRLLPPDLVRLTICGRVVDDLNLFKDFPDVEIRPDVSPAQLTQAYRQADLFVFPSIAEGFGQVLLEALACGLPILSTTSTAAPDLITPGVEGFIVPPGRADLLAERILWATNHRSELADMRAFARARAERFTWKRFRLKVAEAVRQYLAQV